MSTINAISASLRESLPQCSAPLMERIVRRINNYWPNAISGANSLEDSGFEMGYAFNSDRVTAEFMDKNFKNTGLRGIHTAWKEDGKICESLYSSRGSEFAQECYEGPFEGRLLAKVCTVDPSQPISNSMALPSVAQAAGYLIGAIAVAKVAQNLWNGNKKHALGWAVLSAAAFILPNVEI